MDIFIFFEIETFLEKFYVWVFSKDWMFYSYFASSAMEKYLVESLLVVNRFSGKVMTSISTLRT